jgi:hypothetical protein
VQILNLDGHLQKKLVGVTADHQENGLFFKATLFGFHDNEGSQNQVKYNDYWDL